ncbi:unnamed protein product [Polarella glacialis]|uniref:Uncharacterized protein n=1 Tax=Polarella glacialis TaxID=89957 RepID=A0A813K304_POLGL|nr:unnamed protein product [Polarella glacialis]
MLLRVSFLPCSLQVASFSRAISCIKQLRNLWCLAPAPVPVPTTVPGEAAWRQPTPAPLLRRVRFGRGATSGSGAPDPTPASQFCDHFEKALWTWNKISAHKVLRLIQKRECLQANLNGLGTSSDYSGMGCQEMALLLVLTGLVSAGLHLPEPVYISSVCDVQRHCREVLLENTALSGLGHLYQDLKHRVSPAGLAKFEQVRAAMDREWTSTSEWVLAQGAAASSTAREAKAIQKDITASFGHRLMQQYVAVLGEDGVFQDFAPCGKHFKRCPLPHRDQYYQGMRLKMHVAGTTCLDYSSMGLSRKEMGESGAILAIWIKQRLLSLEDAVIQECTPRFDPTVFQEFLGEEYVIIDMGVLNPPQFGWPASRPRRYVVFLRKKTLRLATTVKQFVDGMSFFYEEVHHDSRIFLCAPDEEVESMRASLSAKKFCGPSTSFFRLLNGTQQVRVANYRGLPKVQKMKADGKAVAMNIDQAPDAMEYASAICPTLLTRSTLWSDWGLRPYLPKEHLVIMGVPQWKPFWESLGLSGPFFKASMLCDTKLKSLAGNGMSLIVVGLLQLHVLSSVSKIDNPSEDA